MSIHNSRVLTRHTPCLPEQRLLTFPHGTRVTVRDLFGAMPVRVKHRALQAEKSSFARDWDRVALHVVALLIPWPGAVSVSIRDTASRQSLNFKVGSERRQWVNDSCRLLHHASFLDSPDVSDWVAVGASSPTLSIKGYVCREPVATKRAQFISLGIVPLSNEHRGNVLYDEVNSVFSDSSFGLVEDDSDADAVLKRSKPDGFTQRELKIRKGVDRWPMFFLKMTSTATTAPQALDVDDVLDDRQPNLAIIVDLLKAMFYEFLKRNHCRPRKIALSTKARGQNERVSSPKPTRAASDTSPRKRPSTTNPHPASAGDAARDTPQNEAPDSIPESPFAFWSKVKSGKPLQSFKQTAPSCSRAQSVSTTPAQESQNSTPVLTVPEASRRSTPTGPSSRPSLFDVNGKLTRKPFDDVDPCEMMNRSATREPEPESEAGTDAILVPMHAEEPNLASELPPHDGTVEWVNPLTKMVTVINARTGFAMAPKPLTLSRRAVQKSGGSSRVAEEGPPEKAKEVTPWVKDLVANWNNPVFDVTEAPIPKLPDVVEMLGLEPRPAGHHCHHGQASFSVGTRHETTAMSLQGRLSRETLEKAQLIAQVDKKFIFAKVSFDHVKGRAEDGLLQVPLEPSSVLILIDQHAADERCRVEGLMSNYFHPQTDSKGSKIWMVVTEALPRPVQFELSAQDKDLLVQLQPYFDYWGICYEVEACAPSIKCKTTSRSNKAKVSVTSLPPAISERCRTDPRMLAELIRTEAWRLKDEDRLARPPHPLPVLPRDVADDAHDWVALFHNCPPGIVELINSRSCRSKSPLCHCITPRTTY